MAGLLDQGADINATLLESGRIHDIGACYEIDDFDNDDYDAWIWMKWISTSYDMQAMVGQHCMLLPTTDTSK